MMNRPNAQKVYFITGAAGFVGRRFLELFGKQHPEIYWKILIHEKQISFNLRNSSLVRASLEDRGALSRALEGVDLILHLAAKTHASHKDEYMRVNWLGTKHLVDAAQEKGVRRFVFISTRAISPECGDYAISKRKAEEVVISSGIPHVILRFSEIYGFGSKEGIGELVRFIKTFPVVIYPRGDVSFAPICLEDAVLAMIEVLRRPNINNRIYTLAGPRVYKFRELIETIANALSLRRIFIPIPITFFRFLSSVARFGGKPLFRYDQTARLLCAKDFDISIASRDLDFKPKPFEEGMRSMIDSVIE